MHRNINASPNHNKVTAFVHNLHDAIDRLWKMDVNQAWRMHKPPLIKRAKRRGKTRVVQFTTPFARQIG